jgi:hypothetical protein
LDSPGFWSFLNSPSFFSNDLKAADALYSGGGAAGMGELMPTATRAADAQATQPGGPDTLMQVRKERAAACT